MEKDSRDSFHSSYGSIADSVESETPELSLVEAIEAVGFGRFQIKLFLIVAILYQSEAMEVMMISIISPTLECEWGLSGFEQAMLTTLLIVSTIWMLVFGLLSAVSPSYVWLLVFRGLAGVGLGSVTLAIATFCEYLPAGIRGKAVTALTIFWGVGTVNEVLIGFLVVERLGWQAMVALTATPLILFLAIAPKYLDESARFLLVSGQREKSRKVLEKIARQNRTYLPDGNLVDETSDCRGNIKEMFRPDVRVTTFILFALWLVVTFVYYGFVLFVTELYASEDECNGGLPVNETVATCGLSQKDYISLFFTSFSEILGIIVSVIFIDLLGRKYTMAAQFVIPSISIMCLLACLSNPAMTFFISVARGMFSGGFSTLNTYTPEVYPTHIRAIGMGTCTAFGRIGAMFSPYIAQVASNVSLSIPTVVYSLLSLCAAVLCVILPIETKGRDRGD